MRTNTSRERKKMPIGALAANRTSLMPSNISRKEK
jgi:hypothetical protein